MAKQKVVFGVWANIRISDLNRLLKPHGVRLVQKTSKQWGDAVTISAHALAAKPPVVKPSAGAVRTDIPMAEGFKIGDTIDGAGQGTRVVENTTS